MPAVFRGDHRFFRNIEDFVCRTKIGEGGDSFHKRVPGRIVFVVAAGGFCVGLLSLLSRTSETPTRIPATTGSLFSRELLPTNGTSFLFSTPLYDCPYIFLPMNLGTSFQTGELRCGARALHLPSSRWDSDGESIFFRGVSTLLSPWAL